MVRHSPYHDIPASSPWTGLFRGGGTEQTDRARTDSRRKVQRARIATDHDRTLFEETGKLIQTGPTGEVETSRI